MKKLVVALSTCVALSFVGCIDRDFDLAEVSGEATIGGEELVVPLTDVANIYLGDIIPENDALKKGEDGLYQISFSSFGEDPSKYESISIDGINIPAITGLSPKLEPIEFNLAELPTSFVLDDIKESFSIDFPSLGDDAVQVQTIYVEKAVNINLPSQITGTGYLPDYIAGMIPQLTCKDGDSTSFEASITIMEELEKIDYVEFGSGTEPGARFAVELDLAGIAGINGGGRIKIDVEFPEGYYLCDEKGVGLPIHNILSRDIIINKGDSKIALTVYLQKIDYSKHTFDGGKLNINDTITYSYDLQVSACGGNYDLSKEPKFTMSAQPLYKDIEVKINHIELPSLTHNIEYRFDNIPKDFDIKQVSFVDSHISFYIKGIEWIEIRDNLTDEVFTPSLEIDLPSCMHFKPSPYIKEGNHLLAESADLARGITIDLDYIDFKDPSIVREENAILIKTLFNAMLHMESLDGHTILASSLIPPVNPLNIEIGMVGMKFNIDKATLGDEMVFDFDLNEQMPSLSQEIEVPEMISKIERIVIGKANSNGEPVAIDFTLGVPAGKSFPVEELDINLAVNLGNMLKPTKKTLDEGIIKATSNGYVLSFNESWQPNKRNLKAHLEFEALENLPEIQNGKIKFDQIISVDKCSIRIKNGADIDIEAIKNSAMDINLTIDDIEAREFTGSFDLTVSPEEKTVDLGDVSNLGVDINSLKLNPVLKLNLKDNPTGIPLFADVVLKTMDAKGELLNEIVAPTITIPGSGAATIVISTPRNASSYPDATFIAIPGLADLLSKGIPAKIAVSLVAGADKNSVYTVDLLRAKQGYLIEYQYEVNVPLEFEGDVDLSYSTTISGLNETFATLGDEVNGLKVGDVGVVAEFGTTIPFDIQLAAKLVNKDGTTDDIDAKLVISNDGRIEGWRESDGENPHISKLAIEFSLGESHSLAALKNVDGVQLTFTLTDTGTSATTSLNAGQYINGSLKLRVRDGLSVDVLELLNGNKEE